VAAITATTASARAPAMPTAHKTARRKACVPDRSPWGGGAAAGAACTGGHCVIFTEGRSAPPTAGWPCGDSGVDMFQPRVILHPTDFSDRSAHALGIAADLARQHGAKLLILHVAETLGPENVTYGEVATQLEPAGYRQRVLDDLRKSVPAPPGVSVEYLVAEGDPAEEIDRVARERGCYLIVLGTHGRTGSVAERVVRLAACPVLTVKLPAAG
jgi:universal stress protein A